MIAIVGLISLGLICFRFTLEDTSEVARLVDWFDTGICGFFFVDFVRNWVRAADRKRYLMTWGIVDLISSIPVSNTFRWARVARLIRIFRLIRSLTLIIRGVRNEKRSALLVGIVSASALILAVCSIGVLHFEQHAPGTNIQTADDAVWWSIVTLTSVGYGDHYPVTPAGRFLASWLMLTGLVIFAGLAGIFADLLRSISLQNWKKTESRLSLTEEEILKTILELQQELRTLSARVEQQENQDQGSALIEPGTPLQH